MSDELFVMRNARGLPALKGKLKGEVPPFITRDGKALTFTAFEADELPDLGEKAPASEAVQAGFDLEPWSTAQPPVQIRVTDNQLGKASNA